MERLGGTVDYETIEGQGSTFFICLPIERLAEEHSREAAPGSADVTRGLTRHTTRLGAMVEELVKGMRSK